MKFLVLLATLFISVSAWAATPYKTESTMLLQPDFVFTGRLSQPEALAGYVKAVQAAVTEVLANEEPHPAGGYLVLAIRPGKQAMTWLDFTPELPESVAAKLKTAILAVPAFEVRGGPIVFALNATLWDGTAVQGYPNPKEWDAAAGKDGQGEPMDLDELINKVWPAEAPASAESAP